MPEGWELWEVTGKDGYDVGHADSGGPGDHGAGCVGMERGGCMACGRGKEKSDGKAIVDLSGAFLEAAGV